MIDFFYQDSCQDIVVLGVNSVYEFKLFHGLIFIYPLWY